MAYPHNTLRREFDQVIHDTWTDALPIMDAEQARRRSLGGIPPPFAIVDRGRAEDADWGLANISFEREFQAMYCMGWDDADIDLIEQKVEALKNAMLAATFSSSQATLLTVEEDCSAENPANLIALGQNFQLIGGTLFCRFAFGETAF
jgi:hypothetical protein